MMRLTVAVCVAMMWCVVTYAAAGEPVQKDAVQKSAVQKSAVQKYDACEAVGRRVRVMRERRVIRTRLFAPRIVCCS